MDLCEGLSGKESGEHVESLGGLELRDHMPGTANSDETEISRINGFESTELLGLIEPGLPQGERFSSEARGPVLSSSEGYRGIYVSRIDEDTNAVCSEDLINGDHRFDVMSILLIDDCGADIPVDALLDVHGILDIGLVQPHLSLSGVDARHFALGSEQLVLILRSQKTVRNCQWTLI